MGISIRAYGRHRGVSDAAVRKAIKAGRITSEPDGTISTGRVAYVYLFPCHVAGIIVGI
jgi:hypothetical protein